MGRLSNSIVYGTLDVKGAVTTEGDMTVKGKITSSEFVGTATKVSKQLIIKLNGGTTEGTNSTTFDGSVARTLNITPSSLGVPTSTGSGASGNWGINITGNATTATTATKINQTVAAGATGELIRGTMAGVDYFRMLLGGASNAGYVEIATAKDGNEPIYFRQYTGNFATVTRTLTLLDASGNTILPGTISSSGYTKSGSSNSYVLLGGGGHKSTTSANTASTIVERDASGDINTRYVKSSGDATTSISGGLVYRVNNTTDNTLKVCSSTDAIRTWLGVSPTTHTHSSITTATDSITLGDGDIVIKSGVDGNEEVTIEAYRLTLNSKLIVNGETQLYGSTLCDANLTVFGTIYSRESITTNQSITCTGVNVSNSSNSQVVLGGGGTKSISSSNTANTIVERDGMSCISAQEIKTSNTNLTTISGGLVFRVNNTTDNSLKVCSSTAAIRTWLGVSATSHTHTFASLTSKPTTLSGYGITDAASINGSTSQAWEASDVYSASGVFRGELNNMNHQLVLGITGRDYWDFNEVGGDFRFNSIASTTKTELMRLNKTGLGIGSNNPAYKLDVNGEIRSSSNIRATTSLITPKISSTSNYLSMECGPNKIVMDNTENIVISTFSHVDGIIEMVGNLDIYGDVASFSNDGIFNGTLEIGGKATIKGITICRGGLEVVENSSYFHGDVDFYGLTLFEGISEFNYNVNFNSITNFFDVTYFENIVEVNDDLNVHGQTNSYGSIYSYGDKIQVFSNNSSVDGSYLELGMYVGNSTESTTSGFPVIRTDNSTLGFRYSGLSFGYAKFVASGRENYLEIKGHTSTTNLKLSTYSTSYVNVGGGNFGVGTISPSAKLHVAGTCKIDTSIAVASLFATDSTQMFFYNGNRILLCSNTNPNTSACQMYLQAFTARMSNNEFTDLAAKFSMRNSATGSSTGGGSIQWDMDGFYIWFGNKKIKTTGNMEAQGDVIAYSSSTYNLSKETPTEELDTSTPLIARTLDLVDIPNSLEELEINSPSALDILIEQNSELYRRVEYLTNELNLIKQSIL